MPTPEVDRNETLIHSEYLSRQRRFAFANDYDVKPRVIYSVLMDTDAHFGQQRHQVHKVATPFGSPALEAGAGTSASVYCVYQFFPTKPVVRFLRQRLA